MGPLGLSTHWAGRAAGTHRGNVQRLCISGQSMAHFCLLGCFWNPSTEREVAVWDDMLGSRALAGRKSKPQVPGHLG